MCRSVGLLGSALGDTFLRFCSDASRALIESNSDVVTTYWGSAGRIRLISACAFSIRSGVGGCDANARASVPGFCLSFASIFSKNDTNACGS